MRRLLVAAAVGLLAAPAGAGPTTKTAQDLVEWMGQKFGGRVAAEGTEALTRRVEGLLQRYGDDAAAAIRRAGPRAIHAAEEAGEHAPAALRAIAKFGDEGAAFVAARPAALALASRHGDDCAAVLVKHRGVVDGVVQTAGEPAVRALAATTPRGGRYLAMMHQGGELAAMGRTPDVLAVVAKYGDAAAEFVWRHKGALAVTAVLATFLADPEPYLTGAKELAVEVVKPLASVPAKLAEGAARSVNWTAVFVALLAMGIGFAALRIRRNRRRRDIPGEGNP